MVLDYRHRQLIGNFLCTNCVVPSTSGNAPLVILLCLIYGICVLRYAVHRNDLELAPLFLLTDLKKPVCRSWALQKKVVFHCWAHGWKNESVFQLLLGVCSNRGSGILGDQYLALLSTVWAQILKRWTREVEWCHDCNGQEGIRLGIRFVLQWGMFCTIYVFSFALVPLYISVFCTVYFLQYLYLCTFYCIFTYLSLTTSLFAAASRSSRCSRRPMKHGPPPSSAKVSDA